MHPLSCYPSLCLSVKIVRTVELYLSRHFTLFLSSHSPGFALSPVTLLSQVFSVPLYPPRFASPSLYPTIDRWQPCHVAINVPLSGGSHHTYSAFHPLSVGGTECAFIHCGASASLIRVARGECRAVSVVLFAASVFIWSNSYYLTIPQDYCQPPISPFKPVFWYLAYKLKLMFWFIYTNV